MIPIRLKSSTTESTSYFREEKHLSEKKSFKGKMQRAYLYVQRPACFGIQVQAHMRIRTQLYQVGLSDVGYDIFVSLDSS